MFNIQLFCAFSNITTLGSKFFDVFYNLSCNTNDKSHFNNFYFISAHVTGGYSETWQTNSLKANVRIIQYMFRV